MKRKRFIVEIGTGVDLHGEDATKAACKAVSDAISKSCLCGLVEILGMEDPEALEIDILVGSPKPNEIDLEQVKAVVPIGRKTAQAIAGGLSTKGLCVSQFGPDCDQIMVANAAVTVFISD